MLKSILLSIASAAVFGIVADASSYNGKVFADRNANGIFDRGDKLLSGVMVTDGLNVARTDRSGAFVLPGHEKARFITVTVPSGYMTDNAHYRRIAPQVLEYDFALQPYDAGIRKDGSHTFLQVADSEIFNTDNNEEWVDNIRRSAVSSRAAFIVHTGDICYENGLKSHIGLMNTGNMGIPVYYCIGNHDLVKGRYGEELFESIYGPTWYSFDVAGTHYIVTPMLNGDYRPSYTSADVAAWLANDLACIEEGTPVVVFSHSLLTLGDSFMYKGVDGQGVDLDRHNLKAWIYGHIHTNYIRRQGDVLTVCSSSTDKGGIDHSMAGFRIYTMGKDGRLSSELRYPYLYDKVTVASPSGKVSSCDLTVNAYSTCSPVVSVTYRCSCEGRTVLEDRQAAQATDWSWTASMPVPEEYAGRDMQVEVTVTFADGHSASAESAFTYLPDAAVTRMTGDWTNLLGNASHTAVAAPLDGELHLAWTANVGANIFMTSSLVYDGRVYTATTDEDMEGKSFICSLDGRTGDILWKYVTRGSVKNTIAIDEGLVFAQDIYGWLYAVDALSGTLRWETRLGVNDGLPPLIDGLAAEDGIVYAGSGKGLSAWDAVSGEMLWKNEGWKQREGTTSTLTVGDGVVVGGVQWMALYGNDAATGKMLWSHDDYGLRNRGASPAIHGHLAYVVSANSFFIIDVRSGEIIRSRELPYGLDATSTPLVSPSSVIFGTADKGVVALDRATLEEKWNFKTGNALICTVPYSRPSGAAVETSPVLAGDTVYFGASDGHVYGLDADSGKMVWSFDAGAPVFGSAAVSGNTLVVSDFGGNVYAFAAVAGNGGPRQEKPLRFAVASDFHAPDVPDGEERLAAFIRAADSAGADFIIELGDFCRLDEESRVYRDMWESFDGDGYHVIGNHDMDHYTAEEYVSGMGMPGRYYSFDKGGFHFIVLDGNSLFDGEEYVHYAHGNYYRYPQRQDYIDDRQLEWLKEDLESTGKRCIIFSHQSIDHALKNGADVRKILEDENRRAGFRKVVLAFSGHNHSNYTKVIGGITYMQINSASYVWAGKPTATEKRFPKEINDRYSLMQYSMMYTDPLYAIVTLTGDGAEIDGRQAGFIPPTPEELGMPDSLGVFPLVSVINDEYVDFSTNILPVVFIGDSITQGAGLSDPGTEAPPAAAASFLSEKLPDSKVLFSNQGVSGSTTVDFLPSKRRLFGKVAAAADELSRETGAPLLFSVMLGTNDSAQSGPSGSPVSARQYEADMHEIIDTLLSRYPDAKVVIHSPIWYSPNTHNSAVYLKAGLKRLESYRPAIRRIVKSYSAKVPGKVYLGDTDGFDVFRRNRHGYLQPEAGNSGTFYLHPDRDGAAVLGRLWAEAILKQCLFDDFQ